MISIVVDAIVYHVAQDITEEMQPASEGLVLSKALHKIKLAKYQEMFALVSKINTGSNDQVPDEDAQR